MDKYRSLQIRGYNRPVICFKKFNIKTCEEIQEEAAKGRQKEVRGSEVL